MLLPLRTLGLALYISFCLLLSVSLQALGQSDSVKYAIGAFFGTSTQHYLPHWLTANRFGILQDQDQHATLLSAEAFYDYRIGKHLKLEASLESIVKHRFSDNSAEIWLQQGYAAAQYGIFSLKVGRMERTMGTHAEGLSSGSLALSGNARPIPMLLLEVGNWASVPFTRDFVKFKATYGHGWLGRERYLQHAYLHEKSLYLKFGGDFMLNFSGGLVHYVIWGGRNPALGRLPADLGDYFNIIRGKSGEGIQVNPNSPLQGEISNALGDNLGIYDFGLHARLGKASLTLYHQTPFEDWTGTRLFRNKDRLLGLHFSSDHKDRLVSGIVYEFLYTKYQSGPGLPGAPGDTGSSGHGYDYGGRDNYYNNYLYRTGWVYLDRILGTPLFFTKERARLYVENFSDPDEKKFDFNVVNNRVVAHHIGIEGRFKKLEYKFLGTFTRNFGTYGGINGGINKWGSIENPDRTYAFKPPRNQQYWMLELTTQPFAGAWSALTSIAWDTGALSQNLGVLIGIRRQGILKLQILPR